MQREYDAVVVGSGAGGGIAAYVLTSRGLDVLLLEAGRHYDPTIETPMFQVGSDAPLNAAPTPDKEGGYFDATVNGGTQIPGEPYTVAAGSDYRWWRARMLGGRTNHWGRLSYRYGPYDFQTRRRHGLGVDWPITYGDLAPYYDRVERLIGVFGAAEGIENSPDSPAGILQPPPPPRAYEQWMRMAVGKRLGLQMVPNHAAILTQPLGERPACLYATSCFRGCATRASFQTPTVLLPPALRTGRLQIRTHAMAYEVQLDAMGRAAGVHYIDAATGATRYARTRSVVLAASACETARILLNSRSAAFPDGLANSSGQVGKNLTDSVVITVGGEIPSLRELPPLNDDGATIPHLYLPWWGLEEQAAGRLSFATEYHVYAGGGRMMPSVWDFNALPVEDGVPLHGARLRTHIRESYGSRIALLNCGGMIPNDDCRCDIDPGVKDRWGIPVLRFHWKWGQQELAQADHAVRSMSEMIAAMGGKAAVWSNNTAGSFISGHELGTARMGTSPTDCVLNAFGQSWDVPNLYVADGASFASHACKNPTETIMALAWRASDHLADAFVRRDI
ncbi:MAG TPA: GMC family oxidoreductase [Steroidobacteraceae bacterium]|jgi:choline dehydrogenase-like flavoprotein